MESLKAIIRIQNEIVAAGLDQEAVMRLVVHRMPALLPTASGAAVAMREGDEMVYRAASGCAQEFVGLRLNFERSLAGFCSKSMQIVCADDTERDERVDRDACRRLQIRSVMCSPLMHGDRCVGVFNALAREPRAFSEEDAEALSLISSVIAASIRHAALFEDAVTESRIDALTGLENRRSYDEQMPRLIARSIQCGEPFTLLVFDLDRFKEINDRFGHAAGDCVLKAFGSMIERNVRSTDHAYRMGGDEFAVGMPNCTALGAGTFLKGVSRAADQEAGAYGVRFSAGVAQLQADDSADTLIRRADAAMYECKRAKNRLSCL